MPAFLYFRLSPRPPRFYSRKKRPPDNEAIVPFLFIGVKNSHRYSASHLPPLIFFVSASTLSALFMFSRARTPVSDLKFGTPLFFSKKMAIAPLPPLVSWSTLPLPPQGKLVSVGRDQRTAPDPPEWSFLLGLSLSTTRNRLPSGFSITFSSFLLFPCRILFFFFFLPLPCQLKVSLFLA